jgi:hypothetical protein
MAMVEAEDRFGGPGRPQDPEERRRAAEQRCLDAEQRCFQAERRRFEAERRREQAEALLAQARRAGIKMEQIVGELRKLVASLRDAAGRPTATTATAATATTATAITPAAARTPAFEATPSGAMPSEPSGKGEMVDALTAAIVRLRANVEAVGEPVAAQPSATTDGPPSMAADLQPSAGVALSSAGVDHVAPVADRPVSAIPPRASHKHSMSWIARWRARRKQRR